VVTTGRGFEFDEIASYLGALVVDPAKPLPANPEGVAQLNAALEALVQPLPPLPANPLPETAKAIASKTYAFEPNAAQVKSLSLEFNDPAEATMYLNRDGSDVVWRIGLDGKYRLSSDGLELRGSWEDSQTFVIEVFDIGLSTCRLNFEDSRVVIDAGGLKIIGQQADQ
jgi:hypothetical protein